MIAKLLLILALLVPLSCSRKSERLSDEEQIREAVISYYLKDTSSHQPVTVYFLANEEGHDLDDKLMKRIEALGYIVRKHSQSKMLPNAEAIVDKDTGAIGAKLYVGKIKQRNSEQATVGLSDYYGFDNISIFEAEVIFKEEKWVVNYLSRRGGS